MRSNIVSEGGLTTRLGQWWEGVPFLTSAIVIVCGVIYLICLFVGYDSFVEICFLPSSVVSRFQVYRIFTSVVFHGSLLHVLFNMLALVPLGSELERIMGSVRLLLVIILVATSNALLHVLIALLVAHNPLYAKGYLMNECAIGFSGILFSMIVIETSLSGAQSRRLLSMKTKSFDMTVNKKLKLSGDVKMQVLVFLMSASLRYSKWVYLDVCLDSLMCPLNGKSNIWYPWILLIVFQLLMTNVSLLGHLCGILTGFAYTYGIFNYLLPGSSFYSTIEGTSFLSTCVRRPKFIICTGGIPSGYIPTHSSQNTTSRTLEIFADVSELKIPST
ncbi:hypothetical protein GIB67_034243 [Kingdonia uniflora]|uniref:Peptidase S54 rhomboid domain-containing protein n=1 Tax=Kingdonia uniflora TaxID=39325 RepID=A0A7J7NRL7_9MAGN|nr:hypothetical protein GIB67_034243 [Kingdonia uniflora]